MVERGVTRRTESVVGVALLMDGGKKSHVLCFVAGRGGRMRGALGYVGGRVSKMVTNKDLMGAEKAVVIAVQGGVEDCQQCCG